MYVSNLRWKWHKLPDNHTWASFDFSSAEAHLQNQFDKLVISSSFAGTNPKTSNSLNFLKTKLQTFRNFGQILRPNFESPNLPKTDLELRKKVSYFLEGFSFKQNFELNEPSFFLAQEPN